MNDHLQQAKDVKNDEFYTPYEEVELGVKPYKSYFRNKTVYCNCDDKTSNFYKYFKDNFKSLQLKKLYASGIHHKYVLTYDGKTEIKTPIKKVGDYKSAELTPYIMKSDIICTNPPFSLFREYYTFVHNSGKKFLLIAPLLSIGYKEIFPHIIKLKTNIVTQKSVTFLNGKAVGIIWLTNLPISRPKPLDTGVKLKSFPYKKFDNIAAINVDKIKEIPMDYKGVMGVPITFLNHWNPRQYKIMRDSVEHDAYVDGVNKFSRMFIKKI